MPTPANAGAVHALQLAAWVLQGWMVIVTASIVTLSLLFWRHGANTEQRSGLSIVVLRNVIRYSGGRFLLVGVRKHYPAMHDAIFVGAARPPSATVTRIGHCRPWLLAGGMLAVMLLFSGGASAQSVTPPNMGMFDDIGHFYVQQAQAMADVLRPQAKYLYGLLAVISFALFFMRQAVSSDSNTPTMFGKFTLEIVKAGFFLWLIDVAPKYIMQFMGYFTEAGSRIGQTGTLSPSGIVILGFDACFRTFDAIGKMGWGDTAAFGLPLALAGIGILLCFAAVSVLFLVRIIEMHLIIYGGVLLLGFGGISFTRDIPKNYLSYAISTGTQLFMLYVIVGLGMQLAASWPQSLTTDTTADDVLRQVLQLLVAAIVFASLAWSIPKVAASLVNGSVSMGAADVLGPAAGAAGGAAAGAAVASGGVIALAAATQGAVQASSAGVSLAKEHGASGTMAVVKGLGHAAGALSAEAGAAARAKLGVAPPFPSATNSRGREVGNLGTRAANRLADQMQAAREGKVASPAASPAANDGQGAANAANNSAHSALGIDGGSASQAQGSANGSASAPAFDAPSSANDRRRTPLQPPQIPTDAAPNSAVSIRIDLDD